MSGQWLPFPIDVRDDIPEGWVFMQDGEGRLVPMVAFKPSEDDGDVSSAPVRAPLEDS